MSLGMARRATVRGVLRQLWLIVLVTSLAVLSALLYTSIATPTYSARGTYVIGPSDDITEPDTIVRTFDSLQGQGIVPTLVELLSSKATASRVGERIGLSEAQLDAYDVRANVLSSSNTLELTVRGPDARQTSRLASGIGRDAASTFEGLYSVYQIVPLDEPEQADEPTSPNPVRNVVLSLLLGLTAGTGLAALRASALGDDRASSSSSAVPGVVGRARPQPTEVAGKDVPRRSTLTRRLGTSSQQ